MSLLFISWQIIFKTATSQRNIYWKYPNVNLWHCRFSCRNENINKLSSKCFTVRKWLVYLQYGQLILMNFCGKKSKFEFVFSASLTTATTLSFLKTQTPPESFHINLQLSHPQPVFIQVSLELQKSGVYYKYLFSLV